MPRGSKNLKIMMVGVVPPPVHGQSLATQALFDTDLSPIGRVLVPIRSSKTIESVGRFSLSKALGLVWLVSRTWAAWLRERPAVLYYTAGSGAWVPFCRDLVFLGLCRPLFRESLIHYHSGNLPDFLARSPMLTKLGRFAYGRGAWTIRLGPHCPAPAYPGNVIVDLPNGLDSPQPLPPKVSSDTFRILFLGNLFEEKGVIDLIEAVRILASEHPGPIHLSLVGKFPSPEEEARILGRIAALPANVTCPPPAPAYGSAKWEALACHDVMAFPSYYRAENLPLVIIEAMASSLPVVATSWRGIRSLVEDGRTGFIVPVRDPVAVSSALRALVSEPGLALKMGAAGRARYEERFTASDCLKRAREIFVSACGSASAK